MPHTRPAKGVDVVCSTCIAPNKNLKTVGFKDPIAAYVGRYVDSANTRNVQHVGIRTIRAEEVKESPGGGEIFIEYGEAVAAFSVKQFLANVALDPLSGAGVLRTGSKIKRFGDPTETVAKPSSFFYAETKNNGWVTQTIDTQETLTDFDVSDDGNVYVGTISWGWGISRADTTSGTTVPMATLVQVADSPVAPDSVIALKVGATRFAIISANVVSSRAASLLVYDVSKPATPKLKETRKGKANSITTWARFDPTSRLATVTADGKLRIHAYDKFVKGEGLELASFDPGAKKTFRDLSFDENGTLWAVESSKAPAAGNKLFEFTPSGTTYTKKEHAVFTGSFAPEKVAARKGYVAVGGNAPGATATQTKTELRLYRIVAGKPQFVDTDNFFFRYYHDKNPPAGFASASTYNPSTTALSALHILDHGGKTYLLYSASGLGDVYELKR